MKVLDPDTGQVIETFELCPLVFKGSVCRYQGQVNSCSKTFRCCKKLGNQIHFGGMPSIRTVENAYKTEG